MSTHIIVLENLKDWLPQYPVVNLVSTRDYLSHPDYFKMKDAHVINLSRSYRYLSTGYYCSLLSEARKHKVLPSVRTITDLSRKAIYSLNIEDLDNLVQRSMKVGATAEKTQFEMFIFFGQCDQPALQELARQIFDSFRAPLLKVEFRLQVRWHISVIAPIGINALSEPQQELFSNALTNYLGKRWRQPRAKSVSRYDLAILYNKNEQLPPSGMGALQKFIKAGKRQDVSVELIQKKDYSKLAEYDALFIRETTNIDHYTYLFAKKAEAEGMVVIDDPDSILKCTNKVYLAELLHANRIPTLKTIILQKSDPAAIASITQYPIVLKIPDGSFSRGIFKAQNEQEARNIAENLFKESDLILAQEYLYTEFDWRIGIMNNKPLFACQYFMSKDHWQIVKHETTGRPKQGGYKTWPLVAVPQRVVKTALTAAKHIGNGLYGVDLKENENGVFVIEVNDNPNIDSGVEDNCAGDALYDTIMAEFVRRLDDNRAP